MTPHAAWLLGWALLALMGAISLTIIVPGISRAVDVLFPSIPPRTPSAPEAAR